MQQGSSGSTGAGNSRRLALVDQDDTGDVVELGRIAGELVDRVDDVVDVLVGALLLGKSASGIQQAVVAESLVVCR